MSARPYRLELRLKVAPKSPWSSCASYATPDRARDYIEDGDGCYWRRHCDWRIVDRRTGVTVWPVADVEAQREARP